MKLTKQYIFLSLIVLLSGFSAYGDDSDDKIVYEVSCRRVEQIFENINKKLSPNKQFNINCTETYDERFFGAIKSNFRSQVELSSEVKLCYNPIGGEFNDTILKNTAHIGPSRMNARAIVEILHDHGVKAYIVASGSNVGTLYSVASLNFPICR